LSFRLVGSHKSQKIPPGCEACSLNEIIMTEFFLEEDAFYCTGVHRYVLYLAHDKVRLEIWLQFEMG
jgi:hypothetical protein